MRVSNFLPVFFVFCTATCLRAEAPSLTHLFPPGGQRGATVKVECNGKFDWPVSVFAPGIEASVGEEAGQIEIAIPADLKADRVWVRIFTSEGASEAVPFLIGSLPEINETEPNDAPRQAESIDQLPKTINGVLKGADVDSYSVFLNAGETLVAAIDAHTKIGSPIDSILQVALPSGVVLADNHDSYGLDPRIPYTAKQSGIYIVRVFGFSSDPNQSIALQGCNQCTYRLTLTTGPFLTTAVPLALPVDRDSKVELHGWNVPDGLSTEVQPYNPSALTERIEIENNGELRLPADSSLAIAHYSAMAGSPRVRRVPFETSMNLSQSAVEEAKLLSMPHSVTGRLEKLAQVDRYRVSLQKGDPLLLTVEARTLGLSTDPVLRLLDPDGKKLVEVDDSAGTRDAVLSHQAAVDGVYTVEVFDRYRAGGPFAFYLLTARLEQSDFQLSLTADRFTIPAGETAELAIKVVRRQTVGPITISAANLPDGITAEPVVSEVQGETSSNVSLSFSSNGTPFSGPISIVGSAADPLPLQRTATTNARLGVSFTHLWLTALGAKDEL